MCVSSKEAHPSVNSLLFEAVGLGQAELRGELSQALPVCLGSRDRGAC